MGMAVSYILERKEILLKPNYMTNEEKVNKLSNEGFNDLNNPYIKAMVTVIKGRCLEIAQWKDEQVKQIQEREIKVCNDYIEKNPNNKLMLKYHLGRLSLCDELLGTDSKDKINMAFATMD